MKVLFFGLHGPGAALFTHSRPLSPRYVMPVFDKHFPNYSTYRERVFNLTRIALPLGEFYGCGHYVPDIRDAWITWAGKEVRYRGKQLCGGSYIRPKSSSNSGSGCYYSSPESSTRSRIDPKITVELYLVRT